MAWRNLTKQQWEAIRVHLPQPKISPRGGGPRVDARRCFEGILWILWTGPNGANSRGDMESQHLLAPAQRLGGDGHPAQTLARLLGPAEGPAEAALG
jgi:transposase